MGRTDNFVVIDAPLEHVWNTMMDVESWPSLFTEYAGAEILKRDGNRIEFRLTTHPDPEYDGKVWTWVSERTIDPEAHTSRSRRIDLDQVPFAHMDIEWFFEPADEGGTRMRWVQDFSMKPTAPTTEEQAEDYLNRNTKKQMSVLKEWVEALARTPAG